MNISGVHGRKWDGGSIIDFFSWVICVFPSMKFEKVNDVCKIIKLYIYDAVVSDSNHYPQFLDTDIKTWLRNTLSKTMIDRCMFCMLCLNE